MRNHARKPKTAAPNAPPAARTGMPVAAAAPFELELLALAVDVVETEDLVAAAAEWLEVVVAVAKAAMLSAKIAKNCILFVAKVLVVDVLVE
jgi:hypothetical protein